MKVTALNDCESGDDLPSLPQYLDHILTALKYDTKLKRQTHQHGIDLLEIYCEPESQLSIQVQRLGGKAHRFSRTDGDLRTTEGQQKLWNMICFKP